MLDKLIEINKYELSKFAVNAVAELDMLLKVVENEKLDKDNQFIFNDLDNRVWQDRAGTVTFSNQSSLLLAVKISDKNSEKYGWQIYMIEKDDEGAYQKKYKKMLKNSAQSTLEMVDYSIKPNHVITFKPLDMTTCLGYYKYLGVSEEEGRKFRYSLLDGKENKEFIVKSFSGNIYEVKHVLEELSHVREVLSQEFHEKPLLPVDINTPQYQLKQSYLSYPKTQADFFLRVFMSTGSGYQWNHHGELVGPDTTYHPDIEKIDLSEMDYPKITYLYGGIKTDLVRGCPLLDYPANITPEWEEARLSLIAKLKEVITDFPSWDKEHQDSFLKKDNDYQKFTLEDFAQFIALAESKQHKKLKP